MPPIGNTIRALAASLAAVLVLATAVVGASARSLSFSTQNIRVTWRSLEFITELVAVRCGVTLEGSFHNRTIAKSVGTLIGAITRIDVDSRNCTNGEGIPLRQTGHLTYEGFTGTLPNIRGAHIVISRFGFQFIAPGLCTGAYGSETDSITGQTSINSGELTTLEPIQGRNRVTRTSGSFFCPGSGSFVGSGTPTVLNATTRIRISLI